MQRILFVTSTRIGDAILSSGLLAHLVDTQPQARFTVACGAVTASLFAGVPRLDRVIPVIKGKYAAHWRRLWGQCVGTRWDTVIDLRRSALPWLLLARHRYRLTGQSGAVHRVEENAGVLDLSPPPSPHLWTLPQHDARAKVLVPDGGPVLAIGPTANWRGKTWRAERFVTLVQRLTAPGAAFAGARLAVFSAPGERADAERVLQAVPEDRRLAITDETDLLSVFAAMQRCDGYIGNDSGLMHLAATAGIPTLGLFGPTNEDLYAPWGQNCGVVRTPEAPETLMANPNFDHRTTDSLMDTLTVDAVEAAAVRLWENRG